MQVKRTIKGVAIAAILALSPQIASAQAQMAGKTVTINAQDADLGGLMALIANQANINIVVDGSAGQRKVTLKLTRVPLQTALTAIERAYGLAQANDAGIIHIGAPDVLNKMFPSAGGLVAKNYTISNADPGFISNALQGVMPLGSVIIADARTSSVYVKAELNAQTVAEQTIKQLDIPRVNPLGYSSVSIPVSNVKASDALGVLKTELVPTGNQTLAASDHPNMILVSGSADFIATARGMLFNIDQAGKQVRFKVRVADITPINDNSTIGVLLGAPAQAASTTGGGAGGFSPGTINYSFINKSLPLAATFQALKTTGHGTILAEPEISTLNNEKATLNVGQQYPIAIFNPSTGQNQVQYINAGVNLTITPIIGEDGSVTVTLDTDYSQILSFVGSYPVVGQRHVTNVLRVGDDETIVIAGLFSDITSDTVQKVPVLGDLPFGLGSIFRNRTKSHTRDEIVFMITPHVLSQKDSHKIDELPRIAH